MEVESFRNKTEKPSMDHPHTTTSDAARVLRKRRKRRNICFGAIALLVFIVILIIILAFTVFKAKRPVTTVDSVSLSDLNFSVDLARFRVLLNATLDVDLSIKNPNKVGFKYRDSNAQLNYRGQQIGEAPIPAGKISADQTVPMNLTLTVMADRLIYNSRFFSDVTTGGVLPLYAVTRISGKVNVMNLFKIQVESSTTCDFTVFYQIQAWGTKIASIRQNFNLYIRI